MINKKCNLASNDCVASTMQPLVAFAIWRFLQGDMQNDMVGELKLETRLGIPFFGLIGILLDTISLLIHLS